MLILILAALSTSPRKKWKGLDLDLNLETLSKNFIFYYFVEERIFCEILPKAF